MAAALGQHDDARLTRWVHEHGPAVQAFVRGLVRDRHAADDLVQEVFCRAWAARDRYRDQGCERAYLMQIADRLAVDRARRLGREQPLDPDAWQRVTPADEEYVPELLASQAEAERGLHEALELLSVEQRRTLLLRFYGELEFREIARVLGCPLNTALSHARRGLLSLKRMLADKP